MSVLLVGMALGGPLVGWISDAISLRKPPVIGSAAVCLGAWLFILFLPAPPMPLVNGLLFILGLATGGFIVNFALAREFNAPSLGGTAVGVVNTMVIGSVALMQPLVGTLLDVMWDGRMEAGIRVYDPTAFHAAFLVLPFCAAVGLGAVPLPAREPRPSAGGCGSRPESMSRISQPCSTIEDGAGARPCRELS